MHNCVQEVIQSTIVELLRFKLFFIGLCDKLLLYCSYDPLGIPFPYIVVSFMCRKKIIELFFNSFVFKMVTDSQSLVECKTLRNTSRYTIQKKIL